MTNVAIQYLATANMLLDGQLMGLFEASHHVGFLTFRSINRKNCDLLEHDAVLEGLEGLRAKSLVFNIIQSHPGVFLVDFPSDTIPLNLGFVR